MTQDESLLEWQAPPVDLTGEPLAKPSETTHGITATAMAEDGVHGPAADAAGETEAPVRQASPGT